MGPPVTTIAGTFSRSAAINIPGTILSHDPTMTNPSNWCACAMSSTESAMFSRDGRA